MDGVVFQLDDRSVKLTVTRSMLRTGFDSNTGTMLLTEPCIDTSKGEIVGPQCSGPNGACVIH